MDRYNFLGNRSGNSGLRGGEILCDRDTVGNCSLVRSVPGTGLSAGKTAIGNSGGYDSIEAAREFLDKVGNDASQCKGVVAG